MSDDERVVAWPPELPFAVGLCPSPGHTEEFYMPLTEQDVTEGLNRKCPLSGCDSDLVVYRHD